MSRNAQTKTRKLPAALLLLCSALAVTSARASASPQFLPPPAGQPSEVVIAHDPQATDKLQPRPERVRKMVDGGIMRLTDKASVAEAWLSLVSTQDVVGIKVFSQPGPHSGTRPAVVAAVIEGLLSAGLHPSNVIVWDKRQIDLRLAGYFRLADRFGVRVEGSSEAGYDESAFYDSPLLGTLVWGDLEFEKTGEGIGRKSFVSRLVTRKMTKIINVTPLMNHTHVGVCGNLYSLALGSVDNTMRFEKEPSRLLIAVPEIYNLPILNDRVALNIVDALICQYEGEERSLLHYSTVPNEIRFSLDPVALDTLSILEIETQRELATGKKIKPNLELCTNASLLELGVSDPKKIEVIKVR